MPGPPSRTRETASHPGRHTLLQLRTEFPDETWSSSPPAWPRSWAPRCAPTPAARCSAARASFAELLVGEIESGLEDPSPGRVEEELAALALLEDVKDFLPADWEEKGKLAEE